MNAFLFAWNPDKWAWPDLEQDVKDLAETGIFVDAWSCASHKSIREGDRAYLIKLGKVRKGIIGSGYISSEPFMGENHRGQPRMRILINFERLLNPDNEEILLLDILKSGSLAMQHWSTQSSGIKIKPEVADELEQVWQDFLRNKRRG
jgi:5-methylcytosine-specific restriction protein A